MLSIIHGNMEGPHFSEHNWKEMNDLAKEMIRLFGDRMEGNVLVFYDRKHDFHNIRFKLDGDEYIVRKYKVFGATKNPRDSEETGGGQVLGFDSDYNHITFYYYSDRVIQFFKNNKHKDWAKSDISQGDTDG